LPYRRRLHAGILCLKQSLAGRLCTEPVSATRLAPVSRQGVALQILAEQLTHFICEQIYPDLILKVNADFFF
jgi:hypothetical protein